jgi:prepilin-type N-terminal cleavage/methylation domain-containing protein
MLNQSSSLKAFNRGDTLVEVLFAVAVFSLVAVGALSIMNQGTASAERSLEITLARQQIDAQADTLRYLNASFIAGSPAGTAEWRKIQPIANNNAQATDYNSTSCVVPNNVFVLNTRKAQFADNISPGPATTFPQVRYDGVDNVTSAEGLWVEPVGSLGTGNQAGINYIDFHIRACWDSPGQSFPVTIGTIVRLYEPSS